MSPRKLNTGVLFRGPRHAFTRNQPGEIARSLCFHSDDSDCGPEAESRQTCSTKQVSLSESAQQ